MPSVPPTIENMLGLVPGTDRMVDNPTTFPDEVNAGVPIAPAAPVSMT